VTRRWLRIRRCWRRLRWLRPTLWLVAFVALAAWSIAAEPPVSSGLRLAAACALVMHLTSVMSECERRARLGSRERR
jgi:4-hydroxybenzoate polyprenyltransferase